MLLALNHMTVPTLAYASFLDLARDLGCVGVEARNDLDRPLFDGLAPETARAMAVDRGLRLVGLSQVYPFNSWSSAVEAEVRALIATATACGAETISLIPRNDGTITDHAAQMAALHEALAAIRPMLEDAGLVALVEPLGFPRSSLRSKADTVAAIAEIGAGHVFRIVHDTFHHALAGGGPVFPAETGIIHISGVVDPGVPIEQLDDAHRVLVNADDRLDNVGQIRTLLDAGYDGPVSVECFSPDVHALADPVAAIRGSFEFISARMAAQIA